MGKAARAACIFTPMALTTASLICLVLVMVAQLSNNNKAPLTSADTSRFAASDEANTKKDLLAALSGSISSKTLKDFYLVGLWSYCEGDSGNGIEDITYCSSPTTKFWFDPTDVWGLKTTSVQNVLGDGLQKGLDAYRRVVGWMIWTFIIATTLTAAEFVTCFFTCVTRKASLLTLILSITSSVFVIVAATIVTAAYGVLAGIFNTALESYNLKFSLGKEALLILWLGVALRVASGPFWLPTVCCCKP
ncbi:hypothetical protein EK21DRAFT_104381 [Setomelanomma holmii]|uniref:Uncharacterized protein n=1 Tax=Setomelanomma holmii TaxID=210430 RepID=A0A9P4GY80_9PLEO|nr:hypothetical protein EK21DRAFT_104381 [Setomelanomma holmii]